VAVSPIILALVTSLISSPFEIGVDPNPIAIEDPSTKKAISSLLIKFLAVLSFIDLILVSK
jgi:hypothetical protein